MSALGALSASDGSIMIEKSHQRSLAFGLSDQENPDYSSVAASDFSVLLDQNRALHTHALPVMETLFEQIINTHNMVILTDVNGCILHSLGDDDFLEKANRVALKPGVAWSEASKGTNAIGTAIAEQSSVQIHAQQHFLRANHFLTCSAAPILDHRGNVIGVLDVTGDQCSYHKHTMALVRMSAQMIENHLFLASFSNGLTLHFNTRPEFIGTLMEGIASFSADGRFLSANRSGLFQLGLPLQALQLNTFSSLFGISISALYDHYRTAAPALLNLCMPSGVHVYGRAQLHSLNTAFHQAAGLARAIDGAERAPPPAAATPRQTATPTRKMSGLRYLDTGDTKVSALIEKVSKVLGKDIPILIMGETGTGKELLAQAIHNDSPRAHGPFVAVNCASIPETLIESELFGYEDGAFTGARKKGATGKILQANGGSLFLDEIGDMPLSLQARLLRVLQERMVTPLGSNKSITVNVELICATNRNLREQIAKGLFREDLYYRLNGLVVRLPPLRERSDIQIVVEKILMSEATTQRYTVAPEIMDLFKRHSWPGNFRQLTNLLRTAIVMASEGQIIQKQHLPDDFFEDMEVPASAISATRPPLMASESQNLEQLGVALIQQSLTTHRGNVSATARALGVSRNTIYRKLSALKPASSI
ncbi:MULTISPECIES: sigma-54-dependent Fis family transcriptional regulator [unclassified Undibacterium]|uniref:sigma-54-dependent Fis family transcriptional regulator n=1 Tax=unclassified Undibacterium TaxID=2630295 RepID=UPI002AC9E4B3|nr:MULTISPECIES: sigma-54-dependent Fis family transcriptional regulator [unclassified Undibacterium]MEB0138453.1 sigma-54-dependent Fis family transcriptional regulator [Undibacterium sp. CCC2.1]MEB0171328.1 sigma-54-dependent Fis family transcriptional regulator [Undibacterium sp. CCC1.1]MEB0176435.1 sigma-54-dependent Fis family transcriptional regulator [Undibacterium sp. CCC3.4]MEB0214082.1 sigma-54-dependent Fis family transcriptional regulator [Undibacterium sp. 5I2]WPX43693.1 sigma-54-